MKPTLSLIILFTILFVSCTPSKKSTTYNPNASISSSKQIEDGLSYKTAVIINEKSETSGVHAEYEWIKNHYSNYAIKKQALAYNNKKPYDIITIRFSDGKELPLYFDISKFYGNF